MSIEKFVFTEEKPFIIKKTSKGHYTMIPHVDFVTFLQESEIENTDVVRIVRCIQSYFRRCFTLSIIEIAHVRKIVQEVLLQVRYEYDVFPREELLLSQRESSIYGQMDVL